MKDIKTKDKISGDEIVKIQKKMKKEKITMETALMFIFKEMIDNKSSQLQMQMSNEKGENIELNVILSGDPFKNVGVNVSSEKEKEKEPYGVPTVS